MEPHAFLHAFQALPQSLQRQAEHLAQPHIQQALDDHQLTQEARTQRIHYVLAVQLREIVA